MSAQKFSTKVGAIVVAALVVLVVGAYQSLGVMAQETTASLTIHSRICPVDWAGSDFFANCHDNPGENLTYTVGGPDANTGTSGNVTFSDLAPGAYTVAGGPRSMPSAGSTPFALLPRRQESNSLVSREAET